MISVYFEPQELIDTYFAIRRNIDPINKALAERLLPEVRLTLGEEVLIPLTKGYYARIDREDFDRVAAHNWFVMEAKKGNACTYAGTRVRTSTGQTTLRMHRLITGVTDDEIMVDHWDHDGLNNRRGNLREATRLENRRNSRKAFGRRKSVYVGVSPHPGKAKPWRARIHITEEGKKRTILLGSFLTEVEAALAYNEAATRLHGPFAFQNKIEDANLEIAA